MSTVYNLEPQPTAKVLIETTGGDILLELFAKQTPKTCRNFLQLCLDGYYNGTIFHRLVPGFVIQGGDPTGTGEGGEAIYEGGIFEDEFHSRLKFNRRGLMGMANTGKRDDNGSQFFITLGPTPELQGRNTMFGRVEGDTIYNVMKMGEADLAEGDANERPLYPTRVTNTLILVNPFDDMVHRVAISQPSVAEAKSIVKKSKKRKAGKAILSFGGEDEEEGIEIKPAVKQKKANPTFAPKDGVRTSHPKTNRSPTSQDDVHVPPEKATRKRRSSTKSPSPPHAPIPQTQLPLPDEEAPSRSPSTTPEPEQVTKLSSLLERTNAQIAEMKKSMKRNVPAPILEAREKSALERMIPETSIRGRKRKPGGGGGGGDGSSDTKTIDLLNAFRSKLEKLPISSKTPEGPDINMGDVLTGKPSPKNPSVEADEEGEEAEVCDLHFIANCQSCKSWDQQAENNEQDDADHHHGGGGGGGGDDWMSHTLSFEKDRLGKDLNWKKRNEEELVVIDPREKALSIKEEERAKKLARMSGNTGRAWDRGREKGMRG